MTVAVLFAIVALGALLTGISIVGKHEYQSPPFWIWFVLAAVFSIATVEAGRRSILDGRRLRSPMRRVSDCGTSSPLR